MKRASVEEYPHRRGGHCGSGSFRDLLEWAGLGWGSPPDEGLVFGLGGALDVRYYVSPLLVPPFYLQGRHAEMEQDLCRRLGIGFECWQTDDPEPGWRQLADELDAGRPVLVWADISMLPYLRVRMSNACHCIVVTGYDLDKGIAFVADNDREDIQTVPLEALAKARNSHGFPMPNRHATFPARFPAALPDLLPTARDAAAATVATLRSSERPPETVVPEGVDRFYGLDGLRRFTSDVTGWPNDLQPADLTTALRGLRTFVEKAGTGGGFYRRLQAGFCHQVARTTGDSAFAAAGEAYDACARGWSLLASVADDAFPDTTALIRYATDLPAAEERAVEALEKASRTL